MKTVILKNDAIYHGNLILVNGQYPYHEHAFEKSPLLVNRKYPSVLLARRTATVLANILHNLDATEQILAVSGWRSQQEQASIYRDSMQQNGEAFTKHYVALPAHSEHQTGLAIDLGLNLPSVDFLRPYFPDTGICGAFRRKSVLFGFVERYAKGNEALTGIAHEPWHFRYVGAPHAEIMRDKDLCLEEYLTFLREQTSRHIPYLHQTNEQTIELFYLEAARSGETLFALDDHLPYLVSGDNKNGFIVTVWRDHHA